MLNERSLMPEERRQQIAYILRETGSVKVADLEEKFGISPMTARRDLAALEERGRARRTHGGAILPGFAGHEDSFHQRLEEKIAAKKRLARAAVALLSSGETVFIDSSTTAYYAAQEVLDEGLRITLLTNSLPVMELFTSRDIPNVELVGFGGSLRKLTLSFVGPHTVSAIAAHFADKAFLSVKGVSSKGGLADPDLLEAEVKRTMVERSEEPTLLVEGKKFEQQGLNHIARLSELTQVLVADVAESRLETLSEMGVKASRV